MFKSNCYILGYIERLELVVFFFRNIEFSKWSHSKQLIFSKKQLEEVAKVVTQSIKKKKRYKRQHREQLMRFSHCFYYSGLVLAFAQEVVYATRLI